MNVIISFLFFKNYIARGHVPLPERERALPCGVWSQCNLFSSISLSCCFSSHQAQCLNLSQPCEILLLRRFHGAAGLAQSCILSLWWQLNQCGDRAMERYPRTESVKKTLLPTSKSGPVLTVHCVVVAPCCFPLSVNFYPPDLCPPTFHLIIFLCLMIPYFTYLLPIS